MLSFDRSSKSVVACCACGWRDVALTYPRAARAAAAHAEKAHPGALPRSVYQRVNAAANLDATRRATRK